MHGKDHDGNTPLHIAAQSGNPSNIKALIAVATASTPKANETTDIKNVCNHHHETPLDVAQKKVLEEMKKLGFKGYYTGEYQLSIDLLDSETLFACREVNQRVEVLCVRRRARRIQEFR